MKQHNTQNPHQDGKGTRTQQLSVSSGRKTTKKSIPSTPSPIAGTEEDKPCAKRNDGRYPKTKRVNGRKVFGYGSTPEEAANDLAEKVSVLLATSNQEQEDPPVDEDGTPEPKGCLHWFAKNFWFPTIQGLEPLTIQTYASTYRIHIRDYLGHIMLENLTFQDIQLWLNLKRTEKRVVVNERTGAARTFTVGAEKIRKILEVLRMILNLAVAMRMISFNPASAVKAPKKPKKRVRVMELGVAVKLLENSKGTLLGAPIFLALVCGCRRGEAAAACWSDLNRETGELRIWIQRQAQKGKGVVEKNVKSESYRSLTLTPELIRLLDERGDHSSRYICTFKDGQPWVPQTIHEKWCKVRGDYGLPEWTYHDLRHGAAGLLLATGSNLLEIASVLGHAKPDMSILYTGITATRQRHALAGLSEGLSVSTIVGPEPLVDIRQPEEV